MKQTDIETKELVKEKYGEIAGQSRSQNSSSCCGVHSLRKRGIHYYG